MARGDSGNPVRVASSSARTQSSVYFNTCQNGCTKSWDVPASASRFRDAASCAMPVWVFPSTQMFIPKLVAFSAVLRVPRRCD